ncbi:hypothetical protein RJ641_008990 [Dillenia turbinata]|uniref:Uncharacterized protein n=1 Tax=Dillenia turbinata TaxID=194707 RepID=A0AAN8V4B5_9MAGN
MRSNSSFISFAVRMELLIEEAIDLKSYWQRQLNGPSCKLEMRSCMSSVEDMVGCDFGETRGRNLVTLVTKLSGGAVS